MGQSLIYRIVVPVVLGLSAKKARWRVEVKSLCTDRRIIFRRVTRATLTWSRNT
jgi:hypothetical protein